MDRVIASQSSVFTRVGSRSDAERGDERHLCVTHGGSACCEHTTGLLAHKLPQRSAACVVSAGLHAAAGDRRAQKSRVSTRCQ